MTMSGIVEQVLKTTDIVGGGLLYGIVMLVSSKSIIAQNCWGVSIMNIPFI